eukprot:TRINITY_DN11367_c0_g1_i1.p1 TRINITY_DN11367_c0_g1~~TRINITY_DN11367_c0_g1_i1.p1  ORF type:complete len:397 (-),score=111.21 TRINITY_DN11367_c0_g1_i1:88-1278(-)
MDSPARRTRSKVSAPLAKHPFAGLSKVPLQITKALVTGSNGWVASNIVSLLQEKGVFVRGFDIAPQSDKSTVDDFVRGDLTKAEDVLKACEGMDTVFHVASLVFAPAALVRKVNVTGTQNVAEACCTAGVRRLIYTSSASVVFNGTDIVNGDEDLPYNHTHLDVYNDSKALAEAIVLKSNKKLNGVAYGLKTIAIRPHSIYGPGDPVMFPAIGANVVKGSFKYALHNKSAISSYSYVGNVAHAHWLAAVSLVEAKSVSAGKAYNINDGDQPKMWDRMCSVAGALGLPKDQMGYIPLPFSVVYFFVWALWKCGVNMGKITPFTLRLISTHHYYDISRAEEDLGYEPVLTPEESWGLTLQEFTKSFKAPPPKKSSFLPKFFFIGVITVAAAYLYSVYA